MQPSNAMLAELRTLAAITTPDAPLDVVEDQRLLPMAQAAYSLGRSYGRVELAREVLEDLARGE